MSLPAPFKNKLNINRKKRDLSKQNSPHLSKELRDLEEQIAKQSHHQFREKSVGSQLVNSQCSTAKQEQMENLNPSMCRGNDSNIIVRSRLSQSSQNIEKMSSSKIKIDDQSTTPLQDFKATYDSLHKKFIEKSKEVDRLTMQNKRMEVKLMNLNPQYYEKQIKRLQSQVQKYQVQNQENKHKFFIAQNEKKQFHATAKLKSEQLKNVIKQLQKEKITVVQLRHQINQKEKNYLKITTEMEKSNKSISENYEETRSKLQIIESSQRVKNTDYEQLNRKYESVAKKLQQSEKQFKNYKQTYQRNLSHKNKLLEQYQQKYKELTEKHSSKVQQLQRQLQESQNQKKTDDLLVTQKIQTANIFKNNRLLELQKIKIQEQRNHLQLENKQKQRYIRKLEERLKSCVQKNEYEQLNQVYIQQQQCKIKIVKQYQSKILKIQKELECLKLQVYANTPCQGSQVMNDRVENKRQTFHETLKQQIEQSQKLKQQLATKVEQLFNCKSQLEEAKITVKMMQNQVDILKRKVKSEEKNMKIENDISSQNLKNDLESMKRKLETTQNKLSNKVKELKQKQGFITNVIMGRSRQQDIPLIMSQFQRIFETDYINRLFQAKQKIKQLETKLSN